MKTLIEMKKFGEISIALKGDEKGNFFVELRNSGNIKLYSRLFPVVEMAEVAFDNWADTFYELFKEI